jgi:hypothetical protein
MTTAEAVIAAQFSCLHNFIHYNPRVKPKRIQAELLLRIHAAGVPIDANTLSKVQRVATSMLDDRDALSEAADLLRLDLHEYQHRIDDLFPNPGPRLHVVLNQTYNLARNPRASWQTSESSTSEANVPQEEPSTEHSDSYNAFE